MDKGELPQFESVRKIASIFGGDDLRSLAAVTMAEQDEHIKTFDTYERGLIEHVQGLRAPPYEGKEGENLHFWVREVEIAMDAALISIERLHVAFALSSLGGRAKTWAYTREVTSPVVSQPGLSRVDSLQPYSIRRTTSIASARAFLPVNEGSVSCMSTPKRCEYSLHLRKPHIKVTAFTDGLKVGPSRTHLFHVHADTLEEAIQIALQEEYSHRQVWCSGISKICEVARSDFPPMPGHRLTKGVLR
ncbi:LOW QUALITY PROTEIN: Gag protein [Phytophthora palmivora]|uniref:Gag protein n=1 Tax=Phytophthora palmivora TaxID=4796 RepID=A0A2P4X9P2_9STRA|nr:LOW QUALITY PROTEIN: Gag protein [Phytophthora palmivora]